MLYDRAEHAPLALLYGGHDAGVCGWEHLARTQSVLGYPDLDTADLRAARALLEQLGAAR